jgi:voltage-gated potassium channel
MMTLRLFAMILFNQIGVAVLLLSLTLCLQCAGVITLIEWLKRVLIRDTQKRGPVYSATLVVKSTVAIVILHGLVILLWTSFYRTHCFPSWELAFYFSASSYSTLGYGDLILPSEWRLLGPLEAIIGVLMCGISVSVLFALVIRLLDRDTQSLRTNSTEQSHA